MNQNASRLMQKILKSSGTELYNGSQQNKCDGSFEEMHDLEVGSILEFYLVDFDLREGEMKHFKSAEVREPVTCKFYRDRDCAKDLIKEVGAPGVKDFDALFAGTKVPTDIWVKCAVKKP
ncbi:hypothetical protein FQN53_000800 [Emmonsiellopsis sp. PD_33]|nr:hypothetical protein FQN53_000800 [Emmonsiellopsis sp. PD_33]